MFFTTILLSLILVTNVILYILPWHRIHKETQKKYKKREVSLIKNWKLPIELLKQFLCLLLLSLYNGGPWPYMVFGNGLLMSHKQFFIL